MGGVFVCGKCSTDSDTYNIMSRGKGDRPPGIDSNDLDEKSELVCMWSFSGG